MKTRSLEEAERELSQVSHQIAERRLEIAAAWRKSSTADRLLAVQRMLQDAGVPEKQHEHLEQLHERVRAAWAIVRADKKRAAHDAEARHRVLRAEMDLQIAEGARDRFVSDERLELELYVAAESFVMSRPYGTDHPPLRMLLNRKHALELEVLSKMQNAGTDLDDPTEVGQGNTKVVRILSALTWSGEGMPIS